MFFLAKFNHPIAKHLRVLVIVYIAALASLFTLWLLEHPVKYVLYILEVLLILVLYTVVQGVDLKFRVKFTDKSRFFVDFIPDMLLTSLPFVSIASMLGVLDVDGVVRVGIALLLTSFLSGYALLNLTGLLRHFSILERIVFSYALGYFLTAFLTFAFALLGGVEVWALILCISYVVLGISSVMKRAKNMQSTEENAHRRSSFSKHRDILVLMVIALFFGVAVVNVFPEFSLVGGMDISMHYMQSHQLIRSPNVYVSYPYLWFHLFLASFYMLSSVPLTLSQTALVTLNLMPILAFYIMARRYLEKIDNRLPIISTVFWTLFSGLAWIHFMLLKIFSIDVSELELLLWASDGTYMGTMYSQGLPFTGHVPIVASITLFFMLLYLLKRVDLRRYMHFMLFSILFASCYLTHITEGVMLSVFLALYTMISPSETHTMRRTLLSILLGYIMIGAVYLFLPFLINFVYTPSIIMAIAIPTSLVAVSYLLSKKLKIKLNFGEKARRFALPITLALLFLYILSLLVWSSFKESFSMVYVGEVGFVPWFFYALMLGSTGILAIISIYYFLSNPKYSSLKFFVCLALIAVFFGNILSFINVEFFKTGYWEKRFVFFVAVSFAIIASPNLIRIVQAVKSKITGFRSEKILRALLTTSLLSIIVVFGISSTFLSVEYWSYKYFAPLSDYELEALEFLDKTFDENPNAIVLTVTPISYKMLALAAPPIRLYKNWVFYTAYNPDIAFAILSLLKFSRMYLYLHNRDVTFLDSNFNSSYIMQHLLPNLSPTFQNSEVSIYDAPQIYPPLMKADMTLVVPFNQSALTNTYLYSYDILASQNYTVMFDLDDKIMQERILVLPFDPSEEDIANDDEFTHSPRPEDYLEYAKSGGKLVILNTNGYEFFAHTLFTRLNTTLSASKIVGSEEILFPNIHVPIVQASDGVEVLSYYVNSTDNGAPFSMYKAVDNGEIFYVNVYPLIQVQSSNNAKEGAIYNSLGRLFDVAHVDLQSSSHDDQPKMNIQATFKEVDLTGSVSVSTTSILFPLHIDVKTLNMIVDGETSVLSNVTSLMLGNYNTATISIGDAKISDGTGLYATITTHGTIRMKLSGNNVTIVAKTINGSKEQETLLQGSSAQIILDTDKPLNFYVRVPRIEVIGESSFEELYIDDPMLKWRMRTYGQNLNLKGSTKFTIYYSDTYSLAGDFSFRGSFERNPPILMWNEWSTLSEAAFWGLLMSPFYIGVIFLFYRRNFYIKKKGGKFRQPF